MTTRLDKYDARNLVRKHLMETLPEKTHQAIIKAKDQIFAEIERAAKRGDTSTEVEIYEFLQTRGWFGLFGYRRYHGYYEIVQTLEMMGFRCRPRTRDDENHDYAVLKVSWK